MVKYDPFQIAGAHLEVWNHRQVEPYKQFLAPLATMRSVFEKEERPIVKAIERYQRIWYDAFPDVHWSHTNIIAAGLTMVIEWTATGTHTGRFMEIEPTGRRGEFHGANILTLNEDGKIVRETVHFDLSQILMLTGALARTPEPARIRELARRIPDLLTERNFPALRRMLAPNFRLLSPLAHGDAGMLMGLLSAATIAFPDLVWTARSMAVRVNQAVLELAAEGTQRAPLWDLPNTGRACHVEMALILTFRGELIERLDAYVDSYTFMVALGAVPLPAKL